MALVFFPRASCLALAVGACALAGCATLPAVSTGGAPGRDECGTPDAIRAEIRERIEYYAFLVDGWSPSGTRKEWAEEMFTADAILEGFDVSGKKILDIHGQDGISSSFKNEKAPDRTSNHFIPNTYFLHISCESVVTKSKGFTFAARRYSKSETDYHVFIYRDTWVREAGLWRKKISQVRYID